MLPFAAHPRAYGEYYDSRGGGAYRVGSSPCIRGIHELGFWESLVFRLIPVHTGNTARKPKEEGGHAAHPRAYGEYLNWDKQPKYTPWLIPVHTGNTYPDDAQW